MPQRFRILPEQCSATPCSAHATPCPALAVPSAAARCLGSAVRGLANAPRCHSAAQPLTASPSLYRSALRYSCAVLRFSVAVRGYAEPSLALAEQCNAPPLPHLARLCPRCTSRCGALAARPLAVLLRIEAVHGGALPLLLVSGLRRGRAKPVFAHTIHNYAIPSHYQAGLCFAGATRV
jgi:hypothetical protein